MPPTPSPETILQALRWRYAAKNFDPARKIPAATWAALEETLVLAPSSFGIQPWKFVVVQDPAVRQRLSAASHGQPKVVECSHFVVFAGRKNLGPDHIDRYVARTAEVRNVPVEGLKEFRDMMVGSVERARGAGSLDGWMARQVYIPLGIFVASAALLGIDTGPMEGLVPAEYDEILGLRAQGYGTLCACAAGYRSPNDKYAAAPKVRFKASDVVAHV